MKARYLNFVCDLIAFGSSLCLLFALRWHEFPLVTQLFLFTPVFFFYTVVLYAFGLYENKKRDWLFPGLTALGLNFVGTIAFFFFISRFSIPFSPKGSLVLFFIVFSVLFIILRSIAEKYLQSSSEEKILLVTDDQKLAVKMQKESGVADFKLMKLDSSFLENASRLKNIVFEENIKIIVTDSLPKTETAYQNITELKIEILHPGTFFEKKLRKLYLETAALELPQITEDDFLKKTLEKILALVILIAGLPMLLMMALVIKLSSPGPVIYKQKRVGFSGKIFEAQKFRTMIQDAEKNGPVWAQENDPRITSWGKLIRQTHLDELPQLLNILKGEMNLVGPRPERPEFTASLEEQIKFFKLRQLLKPGLTGWAQINYPYGASVEDAKNKLEYDLYYLKHRSWFLDLVIIIKTVRFFFFNLTRR